MSVFLKSLKCIWDRAPHQAFTDLIRFRDHWICSFREAEGHGLRYPGSLRLLISKDGGKWKSLSKLSRPDLDLRDPKLAVTPDGRLMLSCAGLNILKKDPLRVYCQSFVSFSDDGAHWTDFLPTGNESEWLWRPIWNQSTCYSLSYRTDRRGRSQPIVLYKSSDGLTFEKHAHFQLPDRPTEGTLRFLTNGEALALIRCDSIKRPFAWIGSAKPPYKDWDWNQALLSLGGPNFLTLDKQNWLASGRVVAGDTEMTMLLKMDKKNLVPVLLLPSSGDCSYPGLVWEKGKLFMSYYSSHTGKSSIYFAEIEVVK